MRLRFLAAAAALLLAPLATGCDDGGNPASGTTTPGQEESAFDQIFSFGGTRSESDTAATGNESCASEDCPVDPDPETDDPQILECTAALPIPSGALAACQTFCAKLTGCLGEPAAAAACASDCASTLSGTEIAGVQQIFGCFDAATCDDLADWQDGSPSNVDSPEPTDPRPAEDGGSDAAPIPESDGGGDTPDIPSEGDPMPPREGEVIAETENPIATCLEAVFESWATAPLSASKQAVCDAVPANEARCSYGDSVVVNTGSGEASSGSSDGASAEPAQGDASGDSGAPQEDQAPVPDEGDPYVPSAEDYAEEAVYCHAYGALLGEAAFARLGACDALEDCDARDDCLMGIVACAPFITFLEFAGGARSDSGTVSVEVDGESTPPSVPEDAPTPR